MKEKILYLILLALMLSPCAFGQIVKSKKAEKEFNDLSYANAIKDYTDLIAKGYTSEQAYKNLADAYYFNARYAEASDNYGKLFALEGTDIDAEYMYRYAQTLKSLKKYDASESWMKKFETAKATDKRVIKFSEEPMYRQNIAARSGRYTIKNLSINSPESDFSPSFAKGELVFTSARDTAGIINKRLTKWNNRPFLNLYRANTTEDGDYIMLSKMSPELNKKTHESSTAFTKDGTTVYFTRNNSDNGNFSRDAVGVSRLKIYRADLTDGRWTNIRALPFNSEAYSCAHPTLNADETRLYFASNMEGSYGESDIYAVELNADGSVGIPKNLGDKINTESRETFPFVTSTGVLYFASDGHPGFGGLDVFAVNLTNLDRSSVTNVGEPVNSEQDDFSFIIDVNTKKGLFASNREGGQGSDDLYGFTEDKPLDLRCHTVVAGMVRDLENGMPLEATTVVLYNTKGEQIAEALSAVDGTFTLQGDCDPGEYKLIANKVDYDQGTVLFTSVDGKDIYNIEISLNKTVPKADIGADLTKYLNFKTILFDLNKADIRPDAIQPLKAVIDYMQAYPTVKIRVESHTDVKASADYNVKLSQNRAKNTVAYLVANGIDASRISGKGFGKTRLLNNCTTRESCPDERHQENRRSEFIVVQ